MSQGSSGKNRQRFAARLASQVKEHERKLLDAQVSMPSHVGKLVLVVSNAVSKNVKYEAHQQIEAFHSEADQIAEQRSGQYGGIEVRRSAHAGAIAQDLGDKEVSDLILIGHGGIDRFWLDDGSTLRWRNVAMQARFLKRGRIEQRMCGHFLEYDSVPLGTFALLDQRDLIAPLGVEIDDVDPDETAFRPVYAKPANTADEIRSLIGQYMHMPKQMTQPSTGQN